MNELNFPDDFPVLKTDRLTLSAFSAEDVIDFFNLKSDKEFVKYLGLSPMTKVAQARSRVHSIIQDFNISEGVTWKIAMKGESKLIGYIGYWRILFKHFRGEIGFGIDESYQKQGYMSEAMEAIILWGFNTLGLHSIKADVDPRNKSSIHLLEKFNFKKEAHLRENYFFNDTFIDSLYYGLLKSDL